MVSSKVTTICPVFISRVKLSTKGELLSSVKTSTAIASDIGTASLLTLLVSLASPASVEINVVEELTARRLSISK